MKKILKIVMESQVAREFIKLLLQSFMKFLIQEMAHKQSTTIPVIQTLNEVSEEILNEFIDSELNKL